MNFYMQPAPWSRILFILAAACLLVTCGQPASPTPLPTAPSVPTATTAPPTLVLEPCQIRNEAAQCGTLRVYENRSTRSGRMIDLRVVVVKSQSPNPAPDPIFYLAGGPGVAASEDAAKGQQFPYALSYNHDIVYVDQRGTGGSNRVLIPASPDLSGLAQAEAEQKAREWAAGVLQDIGQQMDPRFYTTSVAMDDLDEVRQALGYDKINLFGHSYGATAAQYYLRQHEAHVRTIMLSGGTLLDIPVFEVWARNGQKALELLFAQCAADSACQAAYPDIRSEFSGLLARLEQTPKTVSMPNGSGSVTFSRDLLAEMVRVMMLDTRQGVKIPRLIHKAYTQDNWAGITQFLSSYGPGDWGPQVMEHVIRCYEKWAAFDPKEVERLGEGSYLKGWYVALAQNHAFSCQLTPQGEMPEGTSPQPHSNVPVLIMNGAWDSQGPPENMAGAQELWPNSLALVEPYQGHWLSDYSEIQCRWAIEADFINKGSVQGLDTSCLSRVQPPAFDTSE